MSVAPPVRRYRRNEYIETPQGTKFAHAAGLFGAANIRLGTKTIVEPDTIIRGDMAKVKVGKHCIIRRGAVLRPSVSERCASRKFARRGWKFTDVERSYAVQKDKGRDPILPDVVGQPHLCR